MTRNKTQVLLPALLCAALAAPAWAAPDGTVMTLDLVRQGDDIVAVVFLDHVMGAPLELDLTYNINGWNVKTEPIDVNGPTVFVENLGPAEQFFGVCASIDGLIRIHGDLTRPTEGTRCDVHFPAPVTNGLMAGVASRAVDIPLPGSRVVLPIERRERSIALTHRR